MNVVVSTGTWFVETRRPRDDQPDNVGGRVVDGSCLSIPELGVKGCDSKGSEDAITDPDEAGDPKQTIELATEDGDVAGLYQYWFRGKGQLLLPKHGDQYDDGHDDVND